MLRANYSTRANGALPASGEVSCAVSVDGPLDLAGITIGLPDSYWASIEPAVRPPLPPCTPDMHMPLGTMHAAALLLRCMITSRVAPCGVLAVLVHV